MEPADITIPFLTTVIGSLPKPAYLYGSTAFSSSGRDLLGEGASSALRGKGLKDAQDDAVKVAVHDQELAGIDIISDGEQRRESYVTYLLRRLVGFDYQDLGEKWVRGGRRLGKVGRCTGPISWNNPILVEDLGFALTQTKRSVKVTLPGPMTVVDSTLDEYYGDEIAMARAVAGVLNKEARALDDAGATVIQFDEPVFSRYPEKVLDWGIEMLDLAAEGISASTAVHICYSYPLPGVPRPIVPSYPTILPALEESSIGQISLEFEEPGLDPKLLELCPSKTIIFGCISNATESIETPEHVSERLLDAARYHPPHMLQAAPDCGLVPLSKHSSQAKLISLVEGAKLARKRLTGTEIQEST